MLTINWIAIYYNFLQLRTISLNCLVALDGNAIPYITFQQAAQSYKVWTFLLMSSWFPFPLSSASLPIHPLCHTTSSLSVSPSLYAYNMRICMWTPMYNSALPHQQKPLWLAGTCKWGNWLQMLAVLRDVIGYKVFCNSRYNCSSRGNCNLLQSGMLLQCHISQY